MEEKLLKTESDCAGLRAQSRLARLDLNSGAQGITLGQHL